MMGLHLVLRCLKILAFIPYVFCSIKTPGNVIKNIGQDAVFMWNTTNGNRISVAKWGLLDSVHKTIKPLFIYMSSSTGPVPGSDLNTIAVRYKGRVSWVGDLSAGHAWFKITNLTLQDTNQYAVTVLEQGQSETSLPSSIHLTVAVPPQFNPQPPQVKNITEGHDLNVPCTAVGTPTPNITWVQGHVTKSTGTGSATLRISTIRRDQNGIYECQARNNPNERPVTTQTAVKVYYQPSIMLGLLKKQTINESDSLNIKCNADGNPPPTIKWKTPTGSVHTGNMYNIPSVSRSHAGTYTCTASNGIGREAMASIQVTVQYQPDINASKSNLTSKSWNGNSIRLRCIATGLPAPLISWYKPTNQQITTGVNIVPGGSEVTVPTTANQGDYGQYKCRATNILGSDEHVINVIQLFPPGKVNISITELEASSFTVRWTKPADDGGLAITGYSLEVSTKPPVVTVNTHAVITGLKANTQYTVKVYARNAAGNGSESVEVITTKKQDKPSVPQLSLTLDQTNGLSVKLSWTKPDDNGGEITKYTIYMKEDGPSELKDIHNILDPKVREYTVKKNLEYEKKYKFLVTAWNKYGESAKQEKLAKSIEIPKERCKSGNARLKASEGKISKLLVGVGIIATTLVVSLVLNVLQFLYIWKKTRRNENRRCQSQEMENSQQRENNETYHNVFELRDKTSSPPFKELDLRKTISITPEYEAVQPKSVSEPYETPGKPSYYQELPGAGSVQDKTRAPVYEPLRTAVPQNDGEANMYQSLGLRNESSDYQSLRTAKGNESVI